MALSTVAAVAVATIGAIAFTGSDDPAPKTPTTADDGNSQPFDRALLEKQAKAQAEQRQNALDDLAKKVNEKA